MAVLLLFHGLYSLLPRSSGRAAALLGSKTVFGFALVLFLAEFVITKIPLLDRFWELAHTLLRPIVGAFLAVASVPETSLLPRIGIGLAGAVATLAAHVTKSTTRLESTAATRGWTHVALSLTEDIVAVVLAALVFFVPWVTALLLATLLVLLLTHFPGGSAPSVCSSQLQNPRRRKPRVREAAVPYLLDGNNLIGGSGAGRASSEDQGRLVPRSRIASVDSRAGRSLFRQARAVPLPRQPLRPVAGAATADDAILREVGRSARPQEMTVVTADRELARRTRDAGGRVTSPSILKRFGAPAGPSPRPRRAARGRDDWMDGSRRPESQGVTSPGDMLARPSGLCDRSEKSERKVRTPHGRHAG